MKYLTMFFILVLLAACAASDIEEVSEGVNPQMSMGLHEISVEEEPIEEAISKPGVIDAGPVDITFRPSYSHGDYGYEQTIEDLVNDNFSQTIVLAKIISSCEPVSMDLSLSTEEFLYDVILTDVSIVEVLKGNLEAGAVITVKEEFNYCVLEHLEKDDEVILFLYGWPGRENEKPYGLFSPYQGCILFAADKNKTRREMSIDGNISASIFYECQDMDDVIEAIEEALEPEEVDD